VPEQFIPAVLAKVKPEYIARTYGISQWADAEDFMAKLAEKSGRLLKKGEVNIFPLPSLPLPSSLFYTLFNIFSLFI